MFPWYAGRSKNFYYDDDDAYPVDNGFHWWEIFLFPFGVILGAIVVFLFDALMTLAIAGVCIKELWVDALATLRSGKLAHPILAYAGGLLAVILLFQSTSGYLNPHQPHILYVVLSIGFILFCTILPLVALLLHVVAVFAQKILIRLAQIKPRSCLLVFIGLVIAWGFHLAYLDQN